MSSSVRRTLTASTFSSRYDFIYIGKLDTLFASNQNFNQVLDQHQIGHTFVETEEWHVWGNWRDYLADFAPRLSVKCSARSHRTLSETIATNIARYSRRTNLGDMMRIQFHPSTDARQPANPIVDGRRIVQRRVVQALFASNSGKLSGGIPGRHECGTSDQDATYWRPGPRQLR